MSPPSTLRFVASAPFLRLIFLPLDTIIRSILLFPHVQMTWAMDATSLDWNRWDSIYLFPPRAMVHALLSKITNFRGEGVLIAGRIPGTVTTMALESRCRGYLELPFPVLSQETDEGMKNHASVSKLHLHAWFL